MKPTTQPGPDRFERIADTPQFSALLAAQACFILPSTVFFLVYYFSLPVLVGFQPELMKRRV